MITVNITRNHNDLSWFVDCKKQFLQKSGLPLTKDTQHNLVYYEIYNTKDYSVYLRITQDILNFFIKLRINWNSFVYK